MFKIVFACAVAAAHPRVHLELEGSPANKLAASDDWSLIGRSDSEQLIELHFAVKQTNLDKLESTLMAVSDPDSSRYGQHLSNEEVHAMIAPTQESLNAINTHLKALGITPVSMTPNEDFLKVDVTVQQAEELLQAEYYEMKHVSHKASVHRVMKYSLPHDVAPHVDFVFPTVHLPPKPRTARKTSDEEPLVANTPPVLRALYNVDVEGVAADNKMAVTAFLDQKYKESDLTTFWGDYCSDGMTCGKGLPLLVGDETTGFFSGIESMLDIETITGVAGNVESEFWGFAGRSPDNKENEPFLKWLTQMSNTSDAEIPKVFSTSYGEDEDSWSLSAATRLNTEFQKAGVRGISLLYASGDEGANCVKGAYKPETPSSSPWVTAVGGTTMSGGKEAAAGLSSGGFSNYWPMPDYQADAVKSYISSASDLPDKKYGYNTSGRAYPDISAQATNYIVVANGFPNPGVAGTSCATPAASGVIALINDARVQAGKSPLGFLNPWIYKNMGAWNDITTGSGGGCSFASGWPASKGWDAVTGAGTPNYKQLVALALKGV